MNATETTFVRIENARGSGRTVKVIEDFGKYAVHRMLEPGEQTRIAVGRYKSVVVLESAAAS